MVKTAVATDEPDEPEGEQLSLSLTPPTGNMTATNITHGTLSATPTMTERPELLRKAHGLIYKDRNETYGHPADDFRRQAVLLTEVLGPRLLKEGARFEATDIPIIMECVKLSRIAETPMNRDHWEDIAGYAGCWDRVTRREDGIE